MLRLCIGRESISKYSYLRFLSTLIEVLCSHSWPKILNAVLLFLLNSCCI